MFDDFWLTLSKFSRHTRTNTHTHFSIRIFSLIYSIAFVEKNRKHCICVDTFRCCSNKLDLGECIKPNRIELKIRCRPTRCKRKSISMFIGKFHANGNHIIKSPLWILLRSIDERCRTLHFVLQISQCNENSFGFGRIAYYESPVDEAFFVPIFYAVWKRREYIYR